MSTTPILPHREIIRDNVTGDYTLLLNGQVVGFAPTRYEAEEALDEVVYAQLTCRPLTEAEALAHELVANHLGLDLADALAIATAKIDKVLAYAAEYDVWATGQAMQAAA